MSDSFSFYKYRERCAHKALLLSKQTLIRGEGTFQRETSLPLLWWRKGGDFFNRFSFLSLPKTTAKVCTGLCRNEPLVWSCPSGLSTLSTHKEIPISSCQSSRGKPLIIFPYVQCCSRQKVKNLPRICLFVSKIKWYRIESTSKEIRLKRYKEGKVVSQM